VLRGRISNSLQYDMDRNTLNKVERNTRTVLAVSLKPLQFVPGDSEESDKAYACYVDGSGAEHRLPCSLAAARRIQGPKPRSEGVTHSLDGKLDKNFVIHLNKDGKPSEVCGVDQLPKLDIMRRYVNKDTVEEPTVELVINTVTGDIDVDVMPATMTNAAILRILKTVDGLTSLEIGTPVSGGYVVADIRGSRVTLSSQ